MPNESSSVTIDDVSQREAELRWDSHAGEHHALAMAVDKAFAAVGRENQLHIDAHVADHISHEREHKLTQDALEKALKANDTRLEGMNQFRQQLQEERSRFVSRDLFDALTNRIIAIEKLDIKSEGKALGQGAVIAAIVGSVSAAGAIISLIIVIANLLSRVPTTGP